MSEKFHLDQNGHLFTKADTVDVIRLDDHDLILDAHSSSRCAWCDAPKGFQVIDGMVCQPEPCPHPDGITTTITLAVPSGRIVVYDDLRHVYDGFNDDFASYNSVLGQAQVIEAMAALGCAFGPVGNSCPDLFRTGEDTYVIASTDYDEDAFARIVPDGWRLMAGIVTDLWAYSIADHDDYISKGGACSTERTRNFDVVEIPSGTYQFTHHTGEKGFDHHAHGTVVFAHINRIEETDQP